MSKGTFNISQGDCITLMSTMKPESFDLVFADPPYHLSNGGFSVASGKQVSVDKGSWDKSRGAAADFEFHLAWLEQVKRVLKPNGTLFVTGTHHSIFKCGFAIEALEFRILNHISWFKPNAAPNLGGRNFAASQENIIWASRDAKSKHTFNYLDMKEFEAPTDIIKKEGKQMRDVWSIPSTPAREKLHGNHPTQKPLALLERIVLASTQPGDMVLDPFSGSGTTGVASVRHGRNYLGIELDPEFVVLSKKRLNQELETGNHD